MGRCFSRAGNPPAALLGQAAPMQEKSFFPAACREAAQMQTPCSGRAGRRKNAEQARQREMGRAAQDPPSCRCSQSLMALTAAS